MQGKILLVDLIRHPRHGIYKLWRDTVTGLYAISKITDPDPTHCAYQSINAILTLKGLEK